MKLKYEVVLNSQKKCQSGPRQARLLWTGPCRSKPWPASSNHYVKSVLFLVITRCRVKIPYGHFGTSFRPLFRHQKIQKREHSTIDVDLHNLFWKGGGAYSI